MQIIHDERECSSDPLKQIVTPAIHWSPLPRDYSATKTVWCLKFANFVFPAGFEERALPESFRLLILRESQTACNQLVCVCRTLVEQVYLHSPIPYTGPNQIWRAAENIWRQLQHGGTLLLTDVDGFQRRFVPKNNRRRNDWGFGGLKWKS